MSMTPASRNALQLALGWAALLVTAVLALVYFDAIRSAVGLRLAVEPLPQSRVTLAMDDTDGIPSHRQGRVEIRAGDDGHFHTTARINGYAVDVMVDTGASIVALSWDDARNAGIHVRDSDFRHRVNTANGVARVAVVMLDSVSIDDITVRNVRAAVAEPGRLSTTLLGMSFLGQLGRTEMSRGVLLLEQ